MPRFPVRCASLLVLLLFALAASGQPADSLAASDASRGSDTTQDVEVVAPDSADTEALAADVPAPPPDWHLHFDSTAGLWGANVSAAYGLLADRTPLDTVVVAVIDSGVDVHHEDLRGVLWTNSDELRNGLDDDGNGYADDLHGWNFIGGPDSTHVHYDTYEVTRLYAPLRARFEGVPADSAAAADSAAYARYLELRAAYETEAAEARMLYGQVQQIQAVVAQAMASLRKYLDQDTVTDDDVADLADSAMPLPPDVQQAIGLLQFMEQNGLVASEVEAAAAQLEAQVEYGYDLDFDPRGIVGDDYADATERLYGNADVIGPAAEHGTHVAGIVAADRLNGVGVAGVAAPVEVMVLRAVPEGDERDKDVANAIRYAVDNGADVVNMSFGKGYSPQKEIVDAAVRYAEEQGVLLVHAAGNNALDLDAAPNYPTRRYLDGTEATNWIEVGASSWEGAGLLAAPFSNYGQTAVDLFAPGVAITSTLPSPPDGDAAYGPNDGTSMAAPVVSGAAALLLAYFPELTPAEVRALLMETATPLANVVVARPDEAAMQGMGVAPTVPFGTLSVSGGLLNVAAAVEAALAREG